MSTVTRKLAVVLAALAAAISMSAIASPAAVASPAGVAMVQPACVADPITHQCLVPPPCLAAGCNGQDPYQTGCASEAEEVDSFYTPSTGTIMLYYSGWCASNWAAMVASIDGVGHVFYVMNAANNTASWGTDQAGSFSWTDMVNGRVLAWACVKAVPAPLCTAKH
jgi:hypothetical protein